MGSRRTMNDVLPPVIFLDKCDLPGRRDRDRQLYLSEGGRLQQASWIDMNSVRCIALVSRLSTSINTSSMPGPFEAECGLKMRVDWLSANMHVTVLSILNFNPAARRSIS